MKKVNKTKEQLMQELVELHQRIAELEASKVKSESAIKDWEEIFDSTADLASVIDKDFRLVKVNRALANALKVEPKELVGKTCYEVVHESQNPPAYCPHIEMMETKKQITREVFEPRLGMHLQVSASPILNKKGEVSSSVHIVKDVTELEKAGEKLRVSEAHYRNLADSITDVFFAMDTDLRYTYWNKASEKLTGVSAKDAIGKSIYQIFPDTEWRRKAVKLYQEVLRTKQPQSLINETQLDGKDYCFEISAYPTAKGLSVFVKDITERKQIEKALLFTRFSLDSASDAMVCIDQEARFVDVNKAHCRAVGYSREELLSMTAHDIDPGYSAEVWPEFWKKLKQSGSLTFESYHRSKEGRIIPVEIIANYFEYDGKEYHCAFARDIAERKQMEESLCRSEQNFRDSIENSPLGVRIVTADGETIFANRALLDIYGYSSLEELKAVPRKQRYTPESYDEHRERARKRERGEHVPPSYEISIVRSDGQVRYLSVSRGEVLWNGEKQFQMVYQDITERKAREQEYQAIIRTAIDGFWQTDMQGHFLDVNEAYCHLTGYSRDELLNTAITDIEAIEKPEETAAHIQKIKEVGYDRFETRHRNKDGGIVDVEISVNYLPTDGGRMFVFIRDITERKRAEGILRMYERIVSTTGDLMSFIDKNYIYQAISETHCKAHGKSREDIIGYSVEDLWGPEIFTRAIRSHLDRCFAGEEVNYESWFDYPTLGRRFMDVTYYPFFYSSGVVSGAVVCSRDITERKQAEEALRGSEQRLKEAQALGKIGNWEFDLATQKIEWSDEVYVLYERDKALGPPSSEEEAGYYAPEEAKRLREFARLTTETGEQFDYGLMAKLPSGRIAFFDATMRPIKDKEGRVIKLFGTVQDVTDREKAEEVIEKQREEYQTIFDSMRPLIAYLGKDGIVMRINRAGASVFGLEPKEVIGKTMHDLFPPDEAETFVRVNMAVISSGKPSLGIATQYTRPSGEKRWAQVDTFPYIDEHGDIIGVIQFNQDITRQKLAEENLEKSYEALRKALLDTIAAMATIVEMKDPYTAGHQARVAQVAGAIAEEMNLPDEQINSIRAAATVHDVGKIYIPAEILNKPGKLSELEFSMIKAHVQGSYDILKNINFPWPIAQITLQHHERLDGSGYPKGLRGEEMLLEAKILAVADIVEAMASHRPYRPALGTDKALEEISLNRGVLYDADVVDTCLKLFTEKGFTFE